MNLTDDDKQWLRQLMREENNVLRMEIEQVRTRLQERIEQVRINFAERLERVETTLLTEFHNVASPTEAHQRGYASVVRALELDVEALQDRVKKLEQRQ